MPSFHKKAFFLKFPIFISRNTTFLSFDPSAGLGLLTPEDETALRWFSVNLLTHTLPNYRASATAQLLNVGSRNLMITLAVPSGATLPKRHLSAIRRIGAFGHAVKLVTLTFEGLGLYEARRAMLVKDGIVEEAEDGAKRAMVRSECMNPIAEAMWEYNGEYRAAI